MRKFYSIILSALLLMTVALPGIAQDERQRKPETIVQDVLAQVPVQKQADYNREMEDLAKIEELANHMQSSSLCALGQTAPNPILSTLKFFSAHHSLDRAAPVAFAFANPAKDSIRSE